MNRLSRIGVVLALGIAAATVTAPAAWALPCTDTVCAHEGRDGGGTVAGFTTADNNFANNRFIDGTAVNDRISSVTNHSSCQDVLMYTNSYWRGNAHRFENFGRPENAGFDNQFSSFRYALSCR